MRDAANNKRKLYRIVPFSPTTIPNLTSFASPRTNGSYQLNDQLGTTNLILKSGDSSCANCYFHHSDQGCCTTPWLLAKTSGIKTPLTYVC